MKKKAFNGVILIKQQMNYNIDSVNIFKWCLTSGVEETLQAEQKDDTNVHLIAFSSCDRCDCQHYYHRDIIVVITIIMIVIINDDNHYHCDIIIVARAVAVFSPNREPLPSLHWMLKLKS